LPIWKEKLLSWGRLILLNLFFLFLYIIFLYVRFQKGYGPVWIPPQKETYHLIKWESIRRAKEFDKWTVHFSVNEVGNSFISIYIEYGRIDDHQTPPTRWLPFFSPFCKAIRYVLHFLNWVLAKRSIMEIPLTFGMVPAIKTDSFTLNCHTSVE
jgi:hypothetical protein